jgi:TolB-like protein
MLRLKLFGQFKLGGPEGPIDLNGKLAALISYLALAGKPVPRDVLATLLWGSHFDEQARQNLRQALVRLRKTVGSEMLISTDSTVHLLPMALDCDAAAFERLSRSGKAEDLGASVELLDGELLAGLDVKQPGWEEWLTKERRRFELMACDALVRLGTVELEQRNASLALQHAKTCIARDWYREDAHRLAMLSLAALGQRAEAVRHFQDMTARLSRDLDTAPEAATSEVAEKVRSQVAAVPFAIAHTRKPSIAVLPFTNLSGDPEQDYFADGVVEEIIMALSRMHWLFVIARNSSFTYKGRAVDVRQVGRELGVRYVLEGSLRKAGARVRIAGNLVDAETVPPSGPTGLKASSRICSICRTGSRGTPWRQFRHALKRRKSPVRGTSPLAVSTLMTASCGGGQACTCGPARGPTTRCIISGGPSNSIRNLRPPMVWRRGPIPCARP